MPSTIWTQCADRFKPAALSVTAWRVVEDQSLISTRKLVDSNAEQTRLEELLETVKPPVPSGQEFHGLHYLLMTPFRYPPWRHGSRFRTARDPGVWYGSLDVDTALAEKAYYRLRFLDDTAASLNSEITLTAFSVPLYTSFGADLTSPPFSAFRSLISAADTYVHSQPLARDLRDGEVAIARYHSARDPRGRDNVAVLHPGGFAARSVRDDTRETWHCYATRTQVEYRSRQFIGSRSLHFDRRIFEVDGVLPRP